MTKSFDEVYALLSSCVRHELRDHAFGDREISWVNSEGLTVAEGYRGNNIIELSVGDGSVSFSTPELMELLKAGTLGEVERNDSQPDEEYEEEEEDYDD